MQLDRTTMPSYYANCITTTCPLMDRCLRSLAWRTRDRAEHITIVNPDLTTSDTSCPYHRPDTRVRYAFGFTRMADAMTRGQYSAFRLAGIRLFSRSGYYRRLNGEYPLSPDEQQKVLDAAVRARVAEPYAFDSYKYRPDW